MTNEVKAHLTLRNVTLALSVAMFAMLLNYFFTGAGGPRHLAVLVVPVALVIQTLIMHQEGYLYPRLPPILNHVIVVAYTAVCFYAIWYFFQHYEQIAIWRQGRYTTQDFIAGLLIFLLVMELSRKAHPILFWVNVVMIAYSLWGYLSPIDFFWHPGTTLYRIVTSSTVELATGVYGRYAQLALTLIAAFLLLAAVARGFEAQGALVQVMRRLAGRSRHTVPQTAVFSSVAVGMVSGSGAANAAVTGTFTIPLMRRYGVPAPFAAAVETSASAGGLIIPPLMAVAGFLMAEFLAVPYWDVVVRGFAVSFVFFASLILAVHLLSVRLLPTTPIDTPPVPLYDWVRTVIFFSGIGFLIVLMGWFGYGALRAALYTGAFLFLWLFVFWLFFMFVLKDPEVTKEERAAPDYVMAVLLAAACLAVAWVYRGSGTALAIWIGAALAVGILVFVMPSLLARIRIIVETHAEMTSYLTLLMATLGIMIGLFTVTGFINRMGSMMLHVGHFHIIATILMAYAFGWLAGAGLPPTATYIIVAIIIAPPLTVLGIDPWVAHFFAFLMAIWGELSPPTSLVAAVSSRIANASFMRTMWEALKICAPITFMSFAIFVRSDMVVETGWPAIHDTLLVTIGVCSFTLAVFGRFVEMRPVDTLIRIVLAVVGFTIMLVPDQTVATVLAVLTLPVLAVGVMRHQRIAGPKEDGLIQPQPAQ